MKRYWTYIMTNTMGTLYTGVTSDLRRRVYEHKNKLVPGFTSRYDIRRLVHYEVGDDVAAAIRREKRIKGMTRAKKMALIRSLNPQWRDLSAEWDEVWGSSLRSE